MAESAPDPTDPRQVAPRLGRIERDVGEIKSDIVLIANRILNVMNEVLASVRLDEHQRRLDAIVPTT
jgi:hypothetical protein